VQEIISELNQIVSRERVIDDPAILPTYLRPASGYTPDGSEPVLPIAVVRPPTTDHVSQILKYANDNGVPVVSFGGGSSLSGGLTANKPSILLDMSQMNNIVSVSLEDSIAIVQSGVTIETLNSVAQTGKVFVGHDPEIVGTTFGGAIATNGRGYLSAKYGSMGDQIHGLEVVLANGEIVTGSSIKDSYSSGLNLSNIFVGTEGIYGVITQAQISLFPEAEERRHYALEFPSFQHGFLGIQRLFADGINPAMVNFVEYAQDSEANKIVVDSMSTAVLHLSLEGPSLAVDEEEAKVWDLVSQLGARDLGPTEAQQFWVNRHQPKEEGGFPQGDTALKINTAVPASRVLELRQQAINIFDISGIHVETCSILGRPEMFSLGIPSGQTKVSQASLREAAEAVMTIAVDMGGAVEHSYGIGVRLNRPYANQLGEGGAQLAKSLKEALDPNGILNPGKILVD
jgi:FAD/FMN-containing dehydrogenase